MRLTPLHRSRRGLHHALRALVVCLTLFVPPSGRAQSSIEPAAQASQTAQAPLRLAVFDTDATPAHGSLLTYDPMISPGELGLRARGVVILGAGRPIVLCSIDWIGVAHEGYAFFCEALARAADTEATRVVINALHQHDAPICDFTTAQILTDFGREPGAFDPKITRPVIERIAQAVAASLDTAQPLTHVGFGSAAVKEVASNRRVLGSDGKVKTVRFSTTKDPAARAEPEGLIDPECSLISFWNQEQPIALLSSYATHPQSYYRTGMANPDFPGLARFLRGLKFPNALHVHFTGAGGNIAAGKYNDGSKENRLILAQRLADGLEHAWEGTKKSPITPEKIEWRQGNAQLGARAELDVMALEKALQDKAARSEGILGAAMQLAWCRRAQNAERSGISVSLLRVGPHQFLSLPGEAFVEFQLAAKKLLPRPESGLVVAAYGDYGPGYIGTEASYAEGGYETQVSSSFVPPTAEKTLMRLVKELMQSGAN